MKEILLLKLGEVVLKGLNRRYFEQRLVHNVSYRMKQIGSFRIYSSQSIIYVEPLEDCDMDAAFDAARDVFGIVSISRAAECGKTPDEIVAAVRTYLDEQLRAASSFKVETKRADKSYPMTSIQLSQYVGGELDDAYPELKADMHTPELIVRVELRDQAAYVHAGSYPGAGGLPAGCGGKAVTLLSGGIDSPVSSYMMAKRGVSLIPVHFFSFPYTSQLAKEKVVTLTKILSRYCGRLTLQVVPFTHIQEEIRDKCLEEYFTLIMRRFMMKIANAIALKTGCGAIITGENLGQVASQTMEALGVTEECVSLPVLRPLIGSDKEEIITVARRIDTFETSILPYEDCCTVFTPKHPRTRPKLEAVLKEEAKLDCEALIAEALENIEMIRID